MQEYITTFLLKILSLPGFSPASVSHPGVIAMPNTNPTSFVFRAYHTLAHHP
jgi:hypothetical protein